MLKGGQGRTVAELLDLHDGCFWVIVLVFVLAVVVAAAAF